MSRLSKNIAKTSRATLKAKKEKKLVVTSIKPFKQWRWIVFDRDGTGRMWSNSKEAFIQVKSIVDNRVK